MVAGVYFASFEVVRFRRNGPETLKEVSDCVEDDSLTDREESFDEERGKRWNQMASCGTDSMACAASQCGNPSLYQNSLLQREEVTEKADTSS